MKILPLAAIALLMALFAAKALQVREGEAAGSGEQPVAGRTVPAFGVPALEGDVLVSHETLLQTGGAVNFFASWCAPCRAEWPHLLELQKAGVPLYGLSFHDKAANIKKLFAKEGDPFTAVGLDDQSEAAMAWGLRGVPETFVFGRNGKLLYHYKGEMGAEETQRVIELYKASSK